MDNMEKSGKRTDLIAAGREKLKEFRKKKDKKKVPHGKSSSKSVEAVNPDHNDGITVRSVESSSAKSSAPEMNRMREIQLPSELSLSHFVGKPAIDAIESQTSEAEGVSSYDPSQEKVFISHCLIEPADSFALQIPLRPHEGVTSADHKASLGSSTCFGNVPDICLTFPPVGITHNKAQVRVFQDGESCILPDQKAPFGSFTCSDDVPDNSLATLVEFTDHEAQVTESVIVPANLPITVQEPLPPPGEINIHIHRRALLDSSTSVGSTLEISTTPPLEITDQEAQKSSLDSSTCLDVVLDGSLTYPTVNILDQDVQTSFLPYGKSDTLLDQKASFYLSTCLDNMSPGLLTAPPVEVTDQGSPAFRPPYGEGGIPVDGKSASNSFVAVSPMEMSDQEAQAADVPFLRDVETPTNVNLKASLDSPTSLDHVLDSSLLHSSLEIANEEELVPRTLDEESNSSLDQKALFVTFSNLDNVPTNRSLTIPHLELTEERAQATNVPFLEDVGRNDSTLLASSKILDNAPCGFLTALPAGITDQEAQVTVIGEMQRDYPLDGKAITHCEMQRDYPLDGEAITHCARRNLTGRKFDDSEVNNFSVADRADDIGPSMSGHISHNDRVEDTENPIICETEHFPAQIMSRGNGEVKADVEMFTGENSTHPCSPGKHWKFHSFGSDTSEPSQAPIFSSRAQHTAPVFDFFEILKESLYVTNIAKDFLDLQLADQSLPQTEINYRNQVLLDEISSVQASISDVQCQNQLLSKEIGLCKNELASVCFERDDLCNQLSSVRSGMDTLSARNIELQLECNRSQTELVKCRKLVADLLVENGKLKGDITGLTNELGIVHVEKPKFVEENENLLLEVAEKRLVVDVLELKRAEMNEKIALLVEEKNRMEGDREHFLQREAKLIAELADCRGLLSGLHVENSNLNDGLNKLIEERNKFTESSESAIEETESLLLELIVSNEVLLMGHVDSTYNEHNRITSGCCPSRGSDAEAFRLNVQVPVNNAAATILPDGVLNVGSVIQDDYSIDFELLQSRFQEAEMIVQNVDALIEQILSHSASLCPSSREGSKVGLGVSKLIQAFESKSQPVNSGDSGNYLSPCSHFLSVRNLIGSLGVVIRALTHDTANATKIFENEKGSLRFANTALMELRNQHESLVDHHDIVVRWGIELDVRCEVLKQEIFHIEAENRWLEMLYGYKERENSNLKMLNGDLSKKVIKWEVMLNALLSRLHEVQRSFDEVSYTVFDQLESLQKGFFGQALILWNDYFLAQVIDKLDKLDGCVGGFSSNQISLGVDFLKFWSHIEASVGSATELIECLQGKFESASIGLEVFKHTLMDMYQNHINLQARSDLAINVLFKVHEDLWKLVDNCIACEEENEYLMKKAQADPFDLSDYTFLLKHLVNVLGYKIELESINTKLSLELSSKIKEIEELKHGFIDPSVACQLIDGMEFSAELENCGIPFSSPHHIISFICAKYKEATCEIEILKEEMALKVADELQEAHLSYLQQDNMILVLKQSLDRTQMNFTRSLSEIQKMDAELNQSGKRVSSLREKLSLAVSKGKGLIVQRDNLKQSLAESSIKLERCSEELIALNKELVNAKERINAYEEAGEREEALESELSHTKNSAMAIREAFLLKDSLIQRIEESLENLKFPEDLHSSDTFQKVNWLVQAAVGKSLPSFEELEDKFYGLTVQNEILKISLEGSNNLVQRWGESIDKIILPFDFQSVEPEGKIKLIGEALSRFDQLNNKLKERIESLETENIYLNSEIENSNWRIAELKEAFEEAQTDKNSLSKNLEELRNESVKMNKKWSDFQVVLNEKKMAEEQIQEMGVRVRTLQCLALDALQYSDGVHDGDGMEYLEELLRNLVEKYRNCLLEKSVVAIANEETTRLAAAVELELVVFHKELETAKADLVYANEEREMYVVNRGAMTREIELLSRRQEELETTKAELARANEEREKYSVKNDALSREITILTKKQDELEITKAELFHANEEKGKYVVKHDTLAHEFELLKADLFHANEERDKYLVKHDVLVHDIEVLGKKQEGLEQACTLEEQKTASLREKLNVAVRKGKLLVQQRDGLKESIEMSNRELGLLRAENASLVNSITQYNVDVKDMHTHKEKADRMEAEVLLLKTHLAENEQISEKMSNLLSAFDAVSEKHFADPVEKLKRFLEVFHTVHESLSSAEQESRKSKRAAELLLAELNEVQERNDSLQEDLLKSTKEISLLSSLKDTEEAAKLKAFSRIEELYNVNAEEMKKLNSALCTFTTSIDEIKSGLSEIDGTFIDVNTMDVELLQNLDSAIKSFSSDAATNSPQLHLSPFSVHIRSLDPTVRKAEGASGAVGDAEMMYAVMGHKINDAVRIAKSAREGLAAHVTFLNERADKFTALLYSIEKWKASEVERLREREEVCANLAIRLDKAEASSRSAGARSEKLENEIEELARKRDMDADRAEASHAKTVKKLSATVMKFDEVHRLCGGLLSEIEKMQARADERDGEVSFLRGELTRSTNEALVSSAECAAKHQDEIQCVLAGIEEVLSGAAGDVDRHERVVGNKVTRVVSELLEARDALLQRNKPVAVSDARPVIEDGEWAAAAAAVGPQGLSSRRNNDQVSIAVVDPASDSTAAGDDDDDKVHGFRSLTTSRFVPRFTRPFSDTVDGLWVSCDRALMRRPALRLCIMFYWSLLHALLAVHMV